MRRGKVNKFKYVISVLNTEKEGELNFLMTSPEPAPCDVLEAKTRIKELTDAIKILEESVG